MKIIVSFSGGKDSQACLIQTAKQYGTDKIEANVCPATRFFELPELIGDDMIDEYTYRTNCI